MMFRPPTAVEPMTLSDASQQTATPNRLGTAFVPAAFRPMMLPSTLLRDVLQSVMWIPVSVLPEMTFRSPPDNPPMVLSVVPH